MADPFKFTSTEGFELLRQLSEPDLGFMPHDYSLVIAGNILDGLDCLFRSACGSGKTGVLALISLCLARLSDGVSPSPSHSCMNIPKNPIILVICPTDALEIDLEVKLKQFKIKALAINSSLCAISLRDYRRDLWLDAKSADVILLAPEQLKGDGFANALKDSDFLARIFLLVVDEVHLVGQWSKYFRKDYGRIGDARNRLKKNTRLLLLTATLPQGQPYDLVLEKFGLTKGHFLDYHRSNLRPEVRVTTIILPSSPNGSFTFPFLSWIIGLEGVSIIFTRNRTLTLKIALYLMRSHPRYASFIRKCDSTNDPEEYDTVTYTMARNITGSSSLILVSTSILTVGIDIPNVRRVISLEPMDFTQEIQEGGRVLRQKRQGEVAEVYTYFSQATADLAAKMVEEDKDNKATGRKKHHSDDEQSTRITLGLAYRIVADCITEEQNSQYNCPPLNKDPCFCSSCANLHIAEEAPQKCISSCCHP
ncbi:P-loop containing nucleoside triphosphate hydrolase protein, partial [Lentinula raphanica]